MTLDQKIEAKISLMLDQHWVFDPEDPLQLTPCILREMLLELRDLYAEYATNSVDQKSIDFNNMFADGINLVLSTHEVESGFGRVLTDYPATDGLIKRYVTGRDCTLTANEALLRGVQVDLLRSGLRPGSYYTTLFILSSTPALRARLYRKLSA